MHWFRAEQLGLAIGLDKDIALSQDYPGFIINRILMPMINEGFRILEEGMARGPADVDTCLVYGYSFPKDKGGPLAFADRLGLRVVRDSLRKMGVKPASLLEQRVGSDQSLVEFWESSEGARGAWERSKSEVHVSRRASRARARL